MVYILIHFVTIHYFVEFSWDALEFVFEKHLSIYVYPSFHISILDVAQPLFSIFGLLYTRCMVSTYLDQLSFYPIALDLQGFISTNHVMSYFLLSNFTNLTLPTFDLLFFSDTYGFATSPSFLNTFLLNNTLDKPRGRLSMILYIVSS